MLEVLSLMSRVVFAPVWVLWKFYTVLWWAFGEGNPPVTETAREEPKGAAFEVVDSRPRITHIPKPVGLLRAGFVGSLGTSALVGLAAHGATQAHWLSDGGAWGAWIWASCVAFVGSVFAVKRVAQRRAEKAAMRRRGLAGAIPAVKAAVAAAGSHVSKARPAWCVAKLAAGRACDVSARAAKSAVAGVRQGVRTFRERTRAATPPTAANANTGGATAAVG